MCQTCSLGETNCSPLCKHYITLAAGAAAAAARKGLMHVLELGTHRGYESYCLFEEAELGVRNVLHAVVTNV